MTPSRLSSPAAECRWRRKTRMLFFGSDGALAVLVFSTSAAVVIVDNVIVVIPVARKLDGSSDEKRIANTSERSTAGPTTVIASAITATAKSPLAA